MNSYDNTPIGNKQKQRLFHGDTGGSPIPDSVNFRAPADPIEDASQMVFAYSASKQQMARNRRLEDDNYVQGSDQEHSQVEGDETTPLDMVRYAMLQLENLSKNEILDDQHTIPNVTSMLQGIEEYLENAAAAAAEHRGKLSYQPVISRELSSPPRLNDPYTPVIDRSGYPIIEPLSTNNPTKYLNMSSLQNDTSIVVDLNRTSASIAASRRSITNTEQKKLKSVYMDNQLDLNETETEYYENMIQKLCEDLQKLGDEKNAIDEQRLFLIAKIEETSDQINTFKESYELERITTGHLEEQIKEMTIRMNDDQKKLYYAKEEVKALQAQVSQLTTELSNSELRRVEESKLNSAQLAAQAKQIKTLHSSIDDLQASEALAKTNSPSSEDANVLQISIEIGELRSEAEELRAQVLTLQADRDAIATEKKKMEMNNIEKIRAQEGLIEELEIAIEDCQSENDRLKEAMNVLRSEKRDSLDDSISGGTTRYDDSNNDVNKVKELTEALGELSEQLTLKDVVIQTLEVKLEHLSQVNTELNCKNIEYENSIAHLEGPLPRSDEPTSENDNADLPSVLKDVRQQLAIAQSEKEAAFEDNARLVTMLDTLKLRVSGSDTDMLQYDDLFDGLSNKLEEKDHLIDELNEQLATFQSRSASHSASKLNTPSNKQIIIDSSVAEVDAGLTNAYLGIDNSSTPGSAGRGATAQFSLTINGEGNDSDDGNEDDVEMDNDSVSFLMAPPPTAAAQNDEVKEEDSATMEALRQTIVLREQQVKAQISQLQFLQDSLSEQKAVNQNLKSQSVTLKTALEEAKEKLSKVSSQADDYRHLLADSERRSSSLQEMVNELTSRNINMKLFGEENMITENEDFNESGQSSGSAKKASAAKTSRLEAEVIELNFQLRSVQKQKEDLQLEFEKLQMRYQTKSKQLEEAISEGQYLREELDGRLQDLDRLKLNEMKFDTSYKLKELDNESQIHFLRERNLSLEATVHDHEEALQAKEEEISEKGDIIISLREVLEKLGEKEDATEELLTELKAEREGQQQTILDLQNIFEKKSNELSALQEQCEEMTARLSRASQSSSEREQDLEAENRTLLGEIEELKYRLETAQEDSRARLTELSAKIQAVMAEKSTVKSELSSKEDLSIKLEQSLHDTEKSALFHLRVCQDICDGVAFFDNRMKSLEQSVSKQLIGKLKKMEDKVSEIKSKSEYAIKVLMSGKEGELNKRLASERELGILKDLSVQQRGAAPFITVEGGGEAPELQQYELPRQMWTEENSLSEEGNGAAQFEEESIYSASNSQYSTASILAMGNEAASNISGANNMRDRANTSRPFIHYNNDDRAVLMQRLEDAERRALSLSSEGARAFARSTKQIAYLEGECTRLKTLVDHLRLVNMKLTGDLKISHHEGIKVKTLEHRLKLLSQDEQLLQSKLFTAESALLKKEKELLAVMDSRLGAAELRNPSQVELIEYVETSDKYRALQEKCRSAQAELEDLKYQHSEKDNTYVHEIEQLGAKLKSTEAEKSNRGRAIEKLESEMMTLKSLLSDRDSSYKQAEVTISILQQEVKMSKDAHQSIVRELTDENLEKQSRIKALEGKLQYLKTQVSELESSYIKNEEETVVRSLKRATIEEENRHFRLLLESQKSELAAGAAQVDELLRSVDGLKLELSTAKDQLVQFQTSLIPDLQKKLQVSDEQLSATGAELEAARRELRINHDLIVSSRDALVKSESSLQNMQTEFLVLRTNEQVLQSDNNSLRNENEYLQRQCEELGKQWMAGSQDIQAMRLTLQEQGDSNQILELKLSDAETKRKVAEAKVELLERLEFDFANEIRSVCESVIVSGQAANSIISVTESTPVPASKSAVDPFCSPPLAMIAQTPNAVSRYSLQSPAKDREGQVDLVLSDNNGDEKGGHFPHMNSSVLSMKNKLQAMVHASKSSYDALLASKSDRDDLRFQLDVLKEKFLKVSIEKDSLEGNASALSGDLSTAKVRLAALEEEKKVLLSDSDHFSQKLFVVLKDLDSCLLDALSVANDVTAGIVPINSIDASSSSSSGSNSQGLQVLWASRSSSDIFGRRNDAPVELLQSFVREVSSGTSYFNIIVKALVSEYQKKSSAAEKLESMLESKEAYWTNERSQFIQQKSSIEIELEQLLNEKQRLNSIQEAHKLETDRLVGQLQELKSKNSELETEFKTTCELNAELRATLSEAEGIYVELNSRSRNLQSEVDNKAEELVAMGQALEDARRRLLDGQISVERHGAAVTRLKAEKDALDNVRRSLESELERSRLELRQIQEHSKSLEMDNRATFEVEKLLAALTNSLDQVMSPSSSSSSAVIVSVQSDLQITSLSDRVDAALKRLQALRGWARDEQRAKRILEQQATALTEDLTLAQESSSDLTLQVKKLQKSSADRERELRDKASEGESQLQELSGLKKDNEKFKKELASVTSQYEESRAQCQSLTLTLQRKEGELSCVTIDLEAKGATIVKLQEQLASTKQQLEDANSESAHRQEQLKAAKLHSDRIMATVHQIERSADEDRKEREIVEKKLIEAEQSSISAAKIKARAVELEKSLQRAQEEVKALNYSKIQGEESNRLLTKELESSKRKINSLESRMNSILMEQNSFADEIAETRKRIAHAKEQAEQERAQRIQSEVAIETLRRLEEKRPHAPLVLQSMAHSEEAAAAVEDEKRNLKLKINELKITCEEKEAQRVAEINDRKKLEKDIRQLQHALEKRNSELNSSAQSSSAFRAEGRRARKAVQAALQQVRDIYQVIVVDAQLPLHEKDLWTQRGKGASDFNYEESLSQGLSEALGINELSTALDALRGAVESSLKGNGVAGTRSKAELLNANNRLTEEVTQLRQQLQELEARKVDAIAQLKDEKLSLQQQLSEQRRYDSKNPHLMHQIATLEDSLRQERERKERALTEIDGLKDRLDKLGRDVVSSLHSKTTKLRQDGNYEQQHLSAELTALRAQKQEAQSELAAATHHRTVLRETIDQLDRRLAAHVETISDLKLQLQMATGQHAASWVDDRDGNEQLVRQVARYKAKAGAMEELAAIYRTSVIALYSDGSSYGAAHFGPVAQGNKISGMGAGWIERELAAVKRSYEEEVRVLDAEISELRAKLRQTTSYSAELRRRYEDSMKSVFRSSTGVHGQQSEDLLRQLEQMRIALESSQADIDLLEQELARLRSDGRKRHAQLLDELAKALQGRDAAVGTLRQLEAYCLQNNWDIKHLADNQYQSDVFDAQAPSATVQKAMSSSYAGTNNTFSVFPESTQQFQQLQQQQLAISTLMRGLVEADHELVEAERRAARHSRSSLQGHGHSSKHRSSSRGRTGHSTHREKDNREDANIASMTSRPGRPSQSGHGEAASSPTSSAQLLRSSNWTAPSSSIHQVPVSSQAGPASTTSSAGSGSLRVSKASKGYY